MKGIMVRSLHIKCLLIIIQRTVQNSQPQEPDNPAGTVLPLFQLVKTRYGFPYFGTNKKFEIISFKIWFSQKTLNKVIQNRILTRFNFNLPKKTCFTENSFKTQ